MQRAISGELAPAAVQLGAYLSAVTTLDHTTEPNETKIFDYKLTTTEVEALSIPEDQRTYLPKYDMDIFRYLVCTFALGHPIMQAASQFLVDSAMAGRKDFLWHKLLPKAWNRDDVKNAMFEMSELVNVYLNVCEFVPIAVDPSALAYSQDPNSYWMQNYDWHSGTLNKLGVRIVKPTEIKSIKPWRHKYGGRVHLEIKLKNETSTEVVVCYIKGNPEALVDRIIRSKFLTVMYESIKGWNMTSSVNQTYNMAAATHLVRDPKSTTPPGGMHAHIVDGERAEGGMMENQFNLFGPVANSKERRTTIMFPAAEAAKQRDDEHMKAMQEETEMMVESSQRAVNDKIKEVMRYGNLEQRVVCRINLEQADANIYPPPERSSMLASYKKEVIATPPSNYSVDGHIQRVNSDIAMLWGLNLTFLQGDSKVYQGVIDKNTKNVISRITNTRKEIGAFYSFLYSCIWKRYDEDHLNYIKSALLSTTMDPSAISSEITNEDQMKIMIEGAEVISRIVVDIEDMKHNTAFTVGYKLPVYSSTTEVVNAGAAAIAAGIKQPEQVEEELDELTEAQTGYVE